MFMQTVTTDPTVDFCLSLDELLTQLELDNYSMAPCQG